MALEALFMLQKLYAGGGAPPPPPPRRGGGGGGGGGEAGCVNISGVHQEAVSFQDGLETLIMLKLLRQKCTCKT